VRMSLPEILVPEWPEDPSLYVQALWGLRCFDVPAITVEDRHRTQMYAAERNRKEAKLNVASIDGWLESIDTKVRVEPLSTLNLPRVAQLYNKTNQLNLSTRRLTEAEIMDWASQPGRAVWSISVSDKFGDLGLTGVLGLAVEGDLVRLVDYVLSCRAMGRMVEETMFHLAVDWARRLKAQRVVATYLPTERNRPTLDVLRKGQLAEESPNEFVWNCTDDYLKPKCINLEVSPSKE